MMNSACVRMLALVLLVVTAPVHAQPAPAWWSFVPSADDGALALVRGQLGDGVQLGAMTVVKLYPPVLDVTDLRIELSSKTGGARLLVPAGRIQMTPATDSAPTMFELTAPAVSLTAPRALEMADLTARMSSGPSGITVHRFEARAYGGRAAGSVTAVASGAPRLTLDLTDISMAQITGKPGRERLTASFAGALPHRLEEFTGSGRATLSGLSTDLTHNATLRSMAAQARRGQETSNAIGMLVQDDALRGLAGALTGAGQAAHYRGVIAGLRRRHDLGTAGGPLKIAKGIATVAPFSGAYLGGKVVLNLMSTALSGHLSRVRLGRVTLLSVAIRGTAGNPGYSVNTNKVLVDGRRPSSGPSVSRGLEREVPRVLMDRALRGRGRGDLLQGLLRSF
jgi:hypothetical protein